MEEEYYEVEEDSERVSDFHITSVDLYFELFEH